MAKDEPGEITRVQVREAIVHLCDSDIIPLYESVTYITFLDSILKHIKDSILKSRDIASPTKAHIVKAMVFPVVMYGCESWTIRKAGC